MTSPEATVGIRGTIVTMHVEKGQEGLGRTTVFVENTLHRVYVNGDNVPSGFKWTNGRQDRIAPEDRRHIGREMAFRGGQGTAAAAPEATRERGRQTPTEQLAAAGGSRVLQDATLKNDAQVAQSLLNTAVQQSPPMGHVSGSLDGNFVTTRFGPGTFSFDVNLFSGSISNGNVAVAPGNADYAGNFSGGSGAATSSGFSMTAPGTVTSQIVMPPPSYPASATVNSSVNLLSAPSGNFSVTYAISTPQFAPSLMGSGTGTGALTKK